MSTAIDKYFLLLFEYLHIMQTSSYVESAANPNIVQIGWNAVAHVYKVAFVNLKNVEDAFQKAQKGMYCFLEYIEQISKQTMLGIDPVEAVVFIYDKVLSPIGESTATISTDAADLPTTLKTIEKLDHLANLLVCFDFQEWTLAERIRVAEDMFYKFANLFLADASMGFDALFQYIEMVKSVAITQPISREQWVAFLNAVYKHTKRAIKQKTVPTEAQVADKCLALKPEIRENGFSAANVDEIAKLVFA